MITAKKVYSKLRTKLILLSRDLAGRLGMHGSLYRLARGSRIIIYHGVCQRNHTRFNTLFVTERVFEMQLRFYKKYFHVISLDDFYKENFSKDRFNICLTFDDGFANNCKYVLPLLEKYKIPATFFVTAIRKEGYDILWNDFLTLSSTEGPGRVNACNQGFSRDGRKSYLSDITKEPLAAMLRKKGFEEKKDFMLWMSPFISFKQRDDLTDYWLQMNVDEIKIMSSSKFVTIGSHGYYHNDLAQVTKEEMVSELQMSKEFLEAIIHKPVTALAFPYGSYSGEVVEEAIKTGYRQLLAAEFMYDRDKENNCLKERMGVNPFISVRNQMFAIIKGNYD